ncbi:hypothetical protein Tco_0849880 [Tanacetum coccineum]
MNENCDLYNESYVLYDRVMNPLAAQLEQKNRKDRGMRRGRRSTSSSFAFDQPSSSHLNDDDDDGNSEGTSCVVMTEIRMKAQSKQSLLTRTDVKTTLVSKENAFKCYFEKNVNNIIEIQDLKGSNAKDKEHGVIHSTSVSRPQLKSYQVKEKVMPNNSQVKFTKKEVQTPELLNGECLFVQKCGKMFCVNSNHDACVSRNGNRWIAMEYVHQFIPWTPKKPLRSKKIWMPKIRKDDDHQQMYNSSYSLLSWDEQSTLTGNLKLLCNFVEKFLGTIKPRSSRQKTFEQSSSSLGLHRNDVSVYTCLNQFKAGSKSCPSSKQDSYITTRVGITIPPSYSNAEDNRADVQCYKLLSRVLRKIIVILTDLSGGDIFRFTMTMEIPSVSSSNSTAVGDCEILYESILVTTGYRIWYSKCHLTVD